MQSEELASLFHRNLTFQNPPPPEPVMQVIEQPAAAQPIVYSISQHYTHSAHVAYEQPSRPASVPNASEQETPEIILARNGVDVANLFPTQIELFKTADQDQQLRLMELWRICPPTYGSHSLAQDLGNWPTTSFEQEEAMAKLRYERQMLEERAAQLAQEQMMTDEPASQSQVTSMQNPNDSCWATYTTHSQSEPEPYMLSGYEALAQRDYNSQAKVPAKDIYSHFGTAIGGPTYSPSTDPVYKASHDWRRSQQQAIEDMENAYGQYQAHNFCQRQVFVHGDHDMM